MKSEKAGVKQFKAAMQIVPLDPNLFCKWMTEMYNLRDLSLVNIDDTFHPVHMNVSVEKDGTLRAARSNFATRDDTYIQFTVIGDYYVALSQEYLFYFDFTVSDLNWEMSIVIGQSDYYSKDIGISLTEEICTVTGHKTGEPGTYQGCIDLNKIISDKSMKRNDGSPFEDTVIRLTNLYLNFKKAGENDGIEIRHLSVGHGEKKFSTPGELKRPLPKYIAEEILLTDNFKENDIVLPLVSENFVPDQKKTSIKSYNGSLSIRDTYLNYDFSMKTPWSIVLYFQTDKGVCLQEILRNIDSNNRLSGKMTFGENADMGEAGYYSGTIDLQKLLFYCQSEISTGYVFDYGRIAKIFKIDIAVEDESVENIIHSLSIIKEKSKKAFDVNNTEKTVVSINRGEYAKPKEVFDPKKADIKEKQKASEVIVYSCGEIVSQEEVSHNDVKKIYQFADRQRMYNFPDGYKVDLPLTLSPDFSMAEYVCKFAGEKVTIVVSHESRISKDIDYYYSETLTKYIGSEDFQKKFGISFNTVQRDIKVGKFTADIFHGHISGLPKDKKADYSYVYLYEKDGDFIYRFLLKYTEDYDYSALEQMIISSFEEIPAYGKAVNTAEYSYPVIPSYWNEETRAFYNHLCGSDIVKWGFFHTNLEAIGLDWYDYYESLADTRFDLVLHYIPADRLHLNVPFAKEIYKRNMVLVLTVRWEKINGEMPMYELMRGKYDEDFHHLAKQIKSVGHPIVIRMENEFNTNWTQTCGLASMCDPEIYRDAWIHFYEICMKENVDNAIFMSNPESEDDYPPQKWNYFVNYIPPREYIQVAGVTAYNHGNTVPHTKLSFEDMYAHVFKNTSHFFENWPWIIGEFGCASPNEDVDKTTWIKEMFQCIHKYPNIKGALWFDHFDGNSEGIYRDFRLFAPVTALKEFMNDMKNEKDSSGTKLWITNAPTKG